jgi:hypothetical protein
VKGRGEFIEQLAQCTLALNYSVHLHNLYQRKMSSYHHFYFVKYSNLASRGAKHRLAQLRGPGPYGAE